MLSLFPFYAFGFKLLAIALRYLSEVGEKHFHAFVLAEDSCSDAAFAAAKHYQTLAIVHS